MSHLLMEKIAEYDSYSARDLQDLAIQGRKRAMGIGATVGSLASLGAGIPQTILAQKKLKKIKENRQDILKEDRSKQRGRKLLVNTGQQRNTKMKRDARNIALLTLPAFGALTGYSVGGSLSDKSIQKQQRINDLKQQKINDLRRRSKGIKADFRVIE